MTSSNEFVIVVVFVRTVELDLWAPPLLDVVHGRPREVLRVCVRSRWQRVLVAAVVHYNKKLIFNGNFTKKFDHILQLIYSKIRSSLLKSRLKTWLPPYAMLLGQVGWTRRDALLAQPPSVFVGRRHVVILGSIYQVLWWLYQIARPFHK